MYSKPLIMDELKTTHTNFQLFFSFNNNITMLMGNSGIGKTVIYTMIQEASVEDDRIVCFNYLDANKNVIDLIRKCKRKLIVIDNADPLLDDEIRKYIAFDENNQYLIIGRNPKNLMTTEDNLFELKSEYNGKYMIFTMKDYF